MTATRPVASAYGGSAITSSVVLWANRGMELLWLLAVVLVPLAFLDRDYVISEAVISYVEVPKIALLRTLAGLMAVLWLTEWALQGNSAHRSSIWSERLWRQPRAWLPGIREWLRGNTARWICLAVGFFTLSTLLSTVLSASFSVSLWGEVPGQDGYPAYTVVAYLILFGVIATHLKTRVQLWRLLGAIALMGLLVAGYAIFQHYGHDFLDLTETTGGGTRRVTSFMGNAIFSAAIMMMTIPITLAAAVISLREHPGIAGATGREVGKWAMDLAISGIWGLVLAIQLLGLAFTFSRGPWLGGIFALGAFLVLALVFVGWRFVLRAGLTLVLSLAFILAVLIWNGSVPFLDPSPWLGLLFALAGLLWVAAALAPWRRLRQVAFGLGVTSAMVVVVLLAVIWFRGDAGVSASGPNSPPPTTNPTAADVAERFSSIQGEVLGGLTGGRVTHWKVSWQLIRDHPWFDFDGLNLSWLRPLTGYGPELFRSTYLLRSPAEGRDLFPLEPDHAHNFFIHQTVEQGYLGLLSSLGIFTAVFVVGGYQLFRARQGYSDDLRLILVVLLAILVGRFLEMMVGVARVSDLTILWVLLAVFAALPVVGRDPQSQVGQVSNPQLSNRRPRNRPRSRSQPATGGYNWRLLWRLALVAWITGGIVVLTWVKSVNYVRAAVEVSEGLEQFHQGDFQSTLASLDRAIELAPDVSLYYNHRANVYVAFLINKNRPKELGCGSQSKLPYDVCLAVRGFQSNLEGARQRPFYYRSHLALANSAYNLPQLKDQTVRWHQESLALVPNSWTIRNELADAYIEAGRPEEAIKVLEESLAITGDTGLSTRALFLRGKAYEKLGDLEKSVSSLERSLNLGLSGEPAKQALRILVEYYISSGQAGSYEPQNHEAYFNRGLIYSGLGHYERAIEDYTHAIDMSRGFTYGGAPQFFGYSFSRGLAYFNLGRYKEAIADMTVAIAQFPHLDRVEAFIIRGISYGELGQAELAKQDLAQNEAAIKDLGPGFRLNPQPANVYYARGLAHLHLDQYLLATAYFDEAIRLDPRNAAAYARRGTAYEALGQQDLAIKDFNEARRLGCSC